VLKVLNRSFGSSILHEITTHRIEQFKRERLAGKWQGYKTHTTKPIRPGTVNRELDTLRAIFSKATEWGQLREHPMRSVKRLKVDNRRTRILTEAEQLALLAACPKKMAAMVRLALITGARFGELLALKWADVTETELWFMETKNGRARALPVSAAISAVLKQVHKVKGSPWVFTNTRTREAYTVNGVAHVFKRAVKRANILTGDVSLHTLRHTALSRMIASGIDDFTVMAISGHRSIRMLERYTHPTNARKIDALESISASLGRSWAESEIGSEADPISSADSLGKNGGRQEARTPDLCVANAALSQLS